MAVETANSVGAGRGVTDPGERKTRSAGILEPFSGPRPVRLLVLGAGGMVARDLLAQASRSGEHSISAFTHAELDVRDDGALGHAITDTAPDWVINGSAYTDVDG